MLSDLEPGEIRKLDRVDNLLPARLSVRALTPLESFQQCRLQPRYAGFRSQHGQQPIRIPMLYQRFPAVPCDTSPTLQAKKSANNMKIIGYLENRADPHNLKVTGSNPVPATTSTGNIKTLQAALRAAFCVVALMSTLCQHNVGGPWQRMSPDSRATIHCKRWGGRPPGGNDVPWWRVLKHR
jgi:hypothetical protein